MEIKTHDVKLLRTETGAGMMDCKKALIESGGDINIAKKILQNKGIAIAQKKSSRAVNEGIIDTYVHPGNKVGVIVEVKCETDFVAMNQEFRNFVHDLTLQIAASNPLYISREEVPKSIVDDKSEIFKMQAIIENKDDAIINKIIKEKIENFYSEICLLEQPFIKDQDKIIGNMLIDLISKVGENIEIKRFCRYQLGER